MRYKDVKTREDLIKYLKYLEKDFIENSDKEWQNVTIDTYIECIAAWLKNNDKIKGDKLSWEDVAGLFFTGKVYE